MNFDWHEHREDQLRKLFADGLSASKIAREIGGITRNSVIGKLHRLGLIRRKAKSPSRFERPRKSRYAKPHNPAAQLNRIVAPQFSASEVTSLTAYETAPIPDTFLGITFDGLQPQHCRYPRGAGENILSCGQPKQDGSSYCAACHARCYGVPKTMNISDAERERRRMQGYLNMHQQRRKAA